MTDAAAPSCAPAATLDSLRAEHLAALKRRSAADIDRTAGWLVGALRARVGAPGADVEADAEAVARDLLDGEGGLGDWLDTLGMEVDRSTIDAARSELALVEVLLDMGSSTDDELLELLAARVPAGPPLWLRIEALLALSRTLADVSGLTDVFEEDGGGLVRLRAERVHELVKWIQAHDIVSLRTNGSTAKEAAAAEQALEAELQDRAIQTLGSVRTTDDSTPAAMICLLKAFLGDSIGVTPKGVERHLSGRRRAAACAAFLARLEREVRAAWLQGAAPASGGAEPPPDEPPPDDAARRARAVAAFGRALDPSAPPATSTTALRELVNGFVTRATGRTTKKLAGDHGKVWTVVEATFPPWTFFPPSETLFDGNDHRTVTEVDERTKEEKQTTFSLPTADAWYHPVEARLPATWVLWDLGDRAPDLLARHFVHHAVARGRAELALKGDRRATMFELTYQDSHDPQTKSEPWCKANEKDRPGETRWVTAHFAEYGAEYGARFRADLLQRVLELVRHRDPDLRRAGFRLMTWTRQARMLPHLVRGLADPMWQAQDVAREFRDATHRGGAELWRPLEPRHLEAAARLLARDASTTKDPLGSLDEDSKALVLEVRTALVALVTDPWAALDGVAFEMQTEALWRVRRIGVPAGPDEWTLLLLALRHPDPELHEWALEGLVDLAATFDRNPYPGADHAARHTELAVAPGFPDDVVRALQRRLEDLWRQPRLRCPPADAAGKPPANFTARVDASVGRDLALLSHLGGARVRAWLAAVVTGHGLPEGVAPPVDDRKWCVRFWADQSLPTECVADLLARPAKDGSTHLEGMPEAVRKAALERLEEEAEDDAGVVEALRGLRALEAARDQAKAPLRDWLEETIEAYKALARLGDPAAKGLVACADPVEREKHRVGVPADGRAAWFLDVSDRELEDEVLGRLDAVGVAALLDVILGRDAHRDLLSGRAEVVIDWLRRAAEPVGLSSLSLRPPFTPRWPGIRAACADLLTALGEALEVAPPDRSADQKAAAEQLERLADLLAADDGPRPAAVRGRVACALLNELADRSGNIADVLRRRRAAAWVLARFALDARKVGSLLFDRTVEALGGYHGEAGAPSDDLLQVLRHEYGDDYESTPAYRFRARDGVVAVMTLSGNDGLRREAVRLRAAHLRALHADMTTALAAKETLVGEDHLAHHVLLQGIRLGDLRLRHESYLRLLDQGHEYAALREEYLADGARQVERFAELLDDYYIQRTLVDLVDVEGDHPEAFDDLDGLLKLACDYQATRPSLLAAEQQLGATFGKRSPMSAWRRLRDAVDADLAGVQAARKAGRGRVARYPLFAWVLFAERSLPLDGSSRMGVPSLPAIKEATSPLELVGQVADVVDLATDEEKVGPLTRTLVEGLVKGLKRVRGRTRHKAALEAAESSLLKYSKALEKKNAPRLLKRVNAAASTINLFTSSIDVIESWEDGVTPREGLEGLQLACDGVEFTESLCEWLGKNDDVVERFYRSKAGKLAKKAGERAGARGARAAASKGAKAIGKKALRLVPVIGNVVGCGLALWEAKEAAEAGDSGEANRRTMESMGYLLLVAAAFVTACGGAPVGAVLAFIGGALVICSYLWDFWEFCYGDNEYEKLARNQGYTPAD